MSLWKPDPTFYASPRDAIAAPPETLAYVAAFARPADRPDAIAVLDTDETSGSYGQVVGWTDLPGTGDELHHFGWNACSSALCPYAPHPHTERRYLVVPACGRPASTSWTPRTIRARPRWSRCSSRTNWASGPATPVRTRSTVDRTGST